MLCTRGVEHTQYPSGFEGLAVDPAANRAVIRCLTRRQEDLEEVLGLSRAQPHGARGGGQPALLERVKDRRALRLGFQFGDLLHEPLDLGVLFRDPSLVARCLLEPLFDLARVLIHRLSAALGLFGLLGHGAMLTRKDGGRVADPSANRELEHGKPFHGSEILVVDLIPSRNALLSHPNCQPAEQLRRPKRDNPEE